MSELIQHFDANHSSQDLMAHILRNTKTPGQTIRFTAPLGEGHIYMQRVRMRISRLRKKLATDGKVIARFTLKTTVKSYAESAQDLVIVTRAISETNILSEILDKELLAEGSKL